MRCIPLGVNDINPGKFTTSVRAGRERGHAELLATSMEFTHMVADIEPSGSGSRATVWTSPRLIESLQQRLANSFKGC